MSDKIVIVSLGYNRVKNFLGAFDSIESAEKAVLDAGAKLVPESEGEIVDRSTGVKRKYKIPRHILVTDQFREWMYANGFFCYEAEGLSFSFDEYPVNQISYGYDTD